MITKHWFKGGLVWRGWAVSDFIEQLAGTLVLFAFSFSPSDPPSPKQPIQAAEHETPWA